MVYLVGWALNYVSLLLLVVKNKFLLLFSNLTLLTYLFIITFFRNSGVDLKIYETVADSIINNYVSIETILFWEPAFVMCLSFFSYLTSSPIFGVRLLSLLFWILILIFWKLSDRVEKIYLLSYYMPVYYYQYSMTVLRAGLASCFILLAWHFLRKDKKLWFYSLSLLSVLFHYSSTLMIVFLWILELKISAKFLISSCLIIIFILWIFITRFDYFDSKILLYLDYDTPSEVSGLSRTILCLVLVIGVILTKFNLATKIKTITFSLLLITCFQMIAFYSYAGLRLLELLAFVLPMLIIRQIDIANIYLKRNSIFIISLYLAGFLGVIFVFRNFIVDYNGSLTGTLHPMLPYRTILNL